MNYLISIRNKYYQCSFVKFKKRERAAIIAIGKTKELSVTVEMFLKYPVKLPKDLCRL